MDIANQNNEPAMQEARLFLSKSHEETNDNEQNEMVTVTKKADIRKDLKTIIFLMYMYFLQGIPLGLAGAIPLILGARKVGFSAQGTFSFAFWPFSIKLLWAPIVDAIYFKKLGRRRSWIVPINFLIAAFMFGFARLAKNLLYTSQTQSGITLTAFLAVTSHKCISHSFHVFILKEIVVLTVIFMLLTILAATQDIVVDGWAISLLSKENVAWQSISNLTGQTAGFFLGNVSFMVLESQVFSNDYIRPVFGFPRQEHGILDLES
jgi:PAT family acetyl-CoA transporter-like MFS transporter 1